MHFPSTHHVHLLRVLKNIELREIFISLSIKSFALGLTGIFIPLYLMMELGYTLNKVLLFYAILSATYMLITPCVAQIANKIGLKHSILLSVPFYITFYLLLYNLETHAELFYLAPIMLAFSACTFWLAYHIDFTKFSDRKYVPEEIGSMLSVFMIMALLGPLVGGFLISLIGFSSLFIVVSFLLVISVVPLFTTEDVHEPTTFSYKHILRKDHFIDLLHFLSLGVRQIGMVFWVVYLFTFLNFYFSLGFVMAAAGFFAAFSSYFFSKFFKIFNKAFILDTLITLYAVAWIARAFMRSLGNVIIITLGSRLLSPMVDIPVLVSTYKRARKHGKIVEYNVFREIGIQVGALLFLAMVWLAGNLEFGFIFIGVLTFTHLIRTGNQSKSL